MGGARLARALVLAALTVGLAAGAHTLGGGASTGPLALGALTALVLPAAVLAAGRRIGVVAALAVLGAGNLALHTLLGWLAACAQPVGLAPGASGGHGGHAGHGSAVHSAVVGCAAPAHGTSSSLPMIAWHLVAVVATAVAFAAVERVWWWLAAVFALAAVVAAPPAVVAATAHAPVWRSVPAIGAFHLRRGWDRRGPPAPPALALAAWRRGARRARSPCPALAATGGRSHEDS